jgi:hypothetical protein
MDLFLFTIFIRKGIMNYWQKVKTILIKDYSIHEYTLFANGK